MNHFLPAPLTDAPLVDDWIRFEVGRHIRLLTGRVELGQGNITPNEFAMRMVLQKQAA